MYKVYLTTGILLLLAGIITTVYLLWFLKNNKLKYQQSILFVSHAIATVFMGIFYVYSVIVMLNNLNDFNGLQQIPLFNILHYGQYLDLTEINNGAQDDFTTTEKNEFEISFGEGEAQPVPDEDIEEILNTSVTENLDYMITTHTPNTSTDSDYLTTTTSQFYLKYQQFLKDVLNKTTYEVHSQSPEVSKRKERNVNNKTSHEDTQPDPENLNNNTICTFKNIFLQHVMLTYSFVHGMIALINAAIDCKDCVGNKEENTVGDNQEKPSGSVEESSKDLKITDLENSDSDSQENVPPIKAENSKPQNYKQLILQLLTILLIPPLCASSVYFTMQDQDVPTISTNAHISKILQNPTNISTVENTNQVNNVVKNIYQIITEVKTKPNLIIPKLSFINQNITSDAFGNSYSPSMSLKIHTFLVFILGYFLVILYSQTTYAKLGSIADPVKARNLKMVLLGFGTLWLPSALEMFSRIYLTRGLPNLVAELLTALGNFSHILTNIGSVLTTKKLAKNQNHVQPVV